MWNIVAIKEHTMQSHRRFNATNEESEKAYTENHISGEQSDPKKGNWKNEVADIFCGTGSFLNKSLLIIIFIAVY